MVKGAEVALVVEVVVGRVEALLADRVCAGLGDEAVGGEGVDDGRRRRQAVRVRVEAERRRGHTAGGGDVRARGDEGALVGCEGAEKPANGRQRSAGDRAGWREP